MRFIDWMRLVALSVLWGGSFLFNEIALESASPMTVVLLRVTIAAAALVAYCFASGIRVELTIPLLVGFAVMGLINNVIPFNLIAWGQTQITGGVASILNATTPLFTVIVAHFWSRGEHATPARIAGVIVGFLGVAVLIGIGNLTDLGYQVLGQLAVLGGAFSYALSAIWGRRLTTVPPFAAAAGMLTASTIMFWPVAMAFDAPLDPLPSIAGIGAILGLALLSTAFAYGIFYRLIADIGSNVMLVTFLLPVSAITLGVVFLGEVVEARHIAGMALIFGGLALVDGRLVTRLRRTPPRAGPG